MGRVLITTATGEPYQPVRMFFVIESRPWVVQVLAQLRCMREVRKREAWVWVYADEAAAVPLSKRVGDLPVEVQPVVLGTMRFPEDGVMMLEVRSLERAIAAARFFGPILVGRARLARVRVVNRWFAEEEMKKEEGIEGLDRWLDGEVVGRAPQGDEAGLPVEDVGELEEIEVGVEEAEAGGRGGDFPELATALRLRGLRAFEWWRGKGVTLREIMLRIAAEGAYWKEGSGRA
ncbi:hypothetical protein [Chondromyces apiculatus]|uniref:Uncharacterized protein n=1 Tax=Chondromyces apiculatus DSM 436 TaxID=1192034 RepID=A0A017TCI3_9BACT|nr:hypothetical protein [Chondromyces apiculatus]EYF06602.1 Hypothetical protein CAP_1732 [Chondromyces apiculatus DSM 436]